MCILSYLPAGVPVPEMDLLTGGINNPDGHGWAIATESDGMLVGKNMDVADALDDFITARELHPNAPALFHSRWATHGGTNLSNVHPFPMGGDERTVVAHNGILSCTPAKGDPRSDTRLFADEILSTRFRRLDKPRAFKAMTNYIGSYNKLAILTVNPRYEKRAYLVNERAGHWDTLTGVWHSNHDYLSTGYDKWTGSWKPSTTTVGYRPLADDYPNRCDICGMGDVSVSGFCDACNSCEDCYEHRNDCLCYVKYAFSTD